MASSKENNVADNSLDEIGSPTKFDLLNEEENFSSPPNNSTGTSEAIRVLNLVRLNSELKASNSELLASIAQKDIIIANLEEQKREKVRQIQKHEANEVKMEMEKIELKQEKIEMKQEKSELKQEKIELQEENVRLNRQLHEMRERHITEMSKFHEESEV